MEFLQTLTDRCVELLEVDAAGLLLADSRGALRLIAASTEQARVSWNCSRSRTTRGRAWTATAAGSSRLLLRVTVPRSGRLAFVTACRCRASASCRAGAAPARPPAGGDPRWRPPFPRWHGR